MPIMKKTGSLLTVAALAASTALSGPSVAYAQSAAVRLAQADPEEVPADAPPPEAAPAAEAAPEAEAPAPAPEPEAAAPTEAPAQEAEPEAPAAEAPAPEPEPEEAPAVEEPAPEAPAAAEPEPAPAPAEAPAAEAPAEAAPEAPAEPASPPTPDAAAPSAETPAAPDAVAPAPTEAPAAPSDAAPAAAAPDAAAPAAPDAAAPAAPDAVAPAAPDAAVPASPDAAAPAAPAPAAPDAAAPASPDAATPAAPAPAADAATPPAAAAATPQPVEAPKPVPAEVQNAPVEQGRIDQSDARVQTLSRPVVEQPITSERGERLREAPRYELPPESKVVKRVGDRDIISIVGAAAAGAAVGAAAGYFIRSNDDNRLAIDSREQYQERLPRGRTRDTIVRANGSQVITITNEYGDVVQRSRIDPDGREVVLFYDPYSEDDGPRPDYYDDPGEDLPPLEVSIPRDRYIVDIDEPDEELYFDTIVAPPVETVERIYSVDEVRRSSRIRDKVRRIDVNTINFDFGSATISQAEVNNLKALADAVSRVIKDNPGETFLIEGHTDAVGSNVANLALSDQRAESVATALSEYFDIPSENLITQGYGEEDLKVDTQSENRENRRVTLRRITALVKPVTAAAR